MRVRRSGEAVAKGGATSYIKGLTHKRHIHAKGTK